MYDSVNIILKPWLNFFNNYPRLVAPVEAFAQFIETAMYIEIGESYKS